MHFELRTLERVHDAQSRVEVRDRRCTFASGFDEPRCFVVNTLKVLGMQETLAADRRPEPSRRPSRRPTWTCNLWVRPRRARAQKLYGIAQGLKNERKKSCSSGTSSAASSASSRKSRSSSTTPRRP